MASLPLLIAYKGPQVVRMKLPEDDRKEFISPTETWSCILNARVDPIPRIKQIIASMVIRVEDPVPSGSLKIDFKNEEFMYIYIFPLIGQWCIWRDFRLGGYHA